MVVVSQDIYRAPSQTSSTTSLQEAVRCRLSSLFHGRSTITPEYRPRRNSSHSPESRLDVAVMTKRASDVSGLHHSASQRSRSRTSTRSVIDDQVSPILPLPATAYARQAARSNPQLARSDSNSSYRRENRPRRKFRGANQEETLLLGMIARDRPRKRRREQENPFSKYVPEALNGKTVRSMALRTGLLGSFLFSCLAICT